MVSPSRDSSIGPESPVKKEASRLTAERGVILEMAGDRAVLLTPGGRFVRVPVQVSSWSIGQEVTFTEADANASAAARSAEARARVGTSWSPRRAAFAWTRRRVAAVAAVLALVLAAPGLYLYANRALPAMAYVSVDINPGVDLGVDVRGRVVSADPTNQDGATVLAKTQVLRLEFEQALKNLTVVAIEAGFLNDQNSLVIVAAVPAKAGTTLPPSLNKTIEKAKNSTQSLLGQKNLGAVVQTIVTDEATRQEAKSHNLSVGKFAIYLTAMSEGLPISVKDLDKGVGQAIKKAGGQVGEIAGKAHERKDYKELSEKFKQKMEEDEKEAEGTEKGKPEGTVNVTGHGDPAGKPGKGSKTDSEGKENEGKENEGQEVGPEGKGGTQPAGSGQTAPGQKSPGSPSSPGQTPSPGEGGALDRPKNERMALGKERPNEPNHLFGFSLSDDRVRAAKERVSVKYLSKDRGQERAMGHEAPAGP